MRSVRPVLLRLETVVAFIVLVAGAAVAASATAETGPAPARVTRVVAEPVPTPSPTPAPTPVPTQAPRGGSLTNRGGGIRWVPSRNAGPWPTDGTVALPTLGMTAPIVRVGVDAAGKMVLPRNGRDVAWLDQGPFPGATNNGVLAGHRNWSGRAGSFEKLERLRDGDPVVVRFGAQSWTFRVIWVRLYDPRNAPVDQLMGYTEHPSVTLITCGGTFNRRTRHYESRWIARAELVEA